MNAMPGRSSARDFEDTSPPDGATQHFTGEVIGRLGRNRKKIILCFDGTGNKFHGNESDSNILKIYRMLDRSDLDQFHYYQPGIGTYVADKSLSESGIWSRFKSWYLKAKDSAVGSRFPDHVMAGYKFLMRYYNADDEIYMFGFSRGAYTARFLAEMLDSVGLLSAGNEEMARFAWKTFYRWQTRQERTEEEQQEKQKLLDFICAFRETFSRPIKRIRFLGLFDTVNSVPTFEHAWMARESRFPYTAKSTARVIRHAVAIDERRAKFRQDLISPPKPAEKHHYWPQLHGYHWRHKGHHTSKTIVQNERGRKWDRRESGLQVPGSTGAFRHQSETSGVRSMSRSNDRASTVGRGSYRSFDEDTDEEAEQDIEEVWFPGGHADIGGGWGVEDGETALSHVPLVWMVREARRAGLNFDNKKMIALNCCHPEELNHQSTNAAHVRISIDPSSPIGEPEKVPESSQFMTKLSNAACDGKLHDVLCRNNGLPAMSVISWNIMEYLPFRRMDLQADGSWKSILWPLPKGETRDVPTNALIHNSALVRMRADNSYRPGNLICGGGGRGVRTAPKELGMGIWKVTKEPGDPVGEVHMRANPPNSIKRSTTDTLAGTLKRKLTS